MFRNPDLLEKSNMVRFDLTTPLTFPGNGAISKKWAGNFPAMTEIDGLIGIMAIFE